MMMQLLSTSVKWLEPSLSKKISEQNLLPTLLYFKRAKKLAQNSKTRLIVRWFSWSHQQQQSRLQQLGKSHLNRQLSLVFVAANAEKSINPKLLVLTATRYSWENVHRIIVTHVGVVMEHKARATPFANSLAARMLAIPFDDDGS